MDNIIDFVYNKIKSEKEKIALDLEISLRLIFMGIFYLHQKRYKSYTKNSFKRLKIENEANKRKKVRECLT